MTRPSCKELILDAAESVVLDDGAGKMTLDLVAKRAGVSKGGILYHFPSKEALIDGMVSRVVARTVSRKEKALADLPESPSRALRADLASVLSKQDSELRVGAGLLAVVANEPALLHDVADLVRERFTRHMGKDKAGMRRAILLLAADGLHFWELLQISPMSVRQRKALVDEMDVLADELTQSS